MAQLVKNLPAMWETWVQFLGWEDPLEKGKETHSSILAWKFHELNPWGQKESDTTEQLLQLVVRTLRLTAETEGSIPGQGTKIPQAAWCDQNRKGKKKKLNIDCFTCINLFIG